jgi:hypothetical protein
MKRHQFLPWAKPSRAPARRIQLSSFPVPVPVSGPDGLRLGTEVLIPAGGWLVAAVSVAAVEPLSAFHQRVAAAWYGLDEAPGRLLPDAWEARRREVFVRGIAIAQPAWKSLNQWAQRLDVEVPGPLAPIPEPD